MTHQKENNADSNVGKDDTHPDFIGQGVQEGEDSWFGLLRLFDHDGDPQRHERFGEVNHLLPNESDRQWGDCYVCFLLRRKKQRVLKYLFFPLFKYI